MFASGPSTASAARQCIRSFSTTRLCRSKIGSAPLSLPQEVKFNITPSAVVEAGRGVSRDGQGSMVEISGPLGTMKMHIPAYMSIEANEESRTRTLSILDANDRKQREMWGE
jgi:large subunit ribosomal protein L6